MGDGGILSLRPTSLRLAGDDEALNETSKSSDLSSPYLKFEYNGPQNLAGKLTWKKSHLSFESEIHLWFWSASEPFLYKIQMSFRREFIENSVKTHLFRFFLLLFSLQF